MVTLILFLTSVFAIAGEFPDQEMTGHWIGQCKIIVSWCEQESLQVDIEINQTGSVMGRIGDAKIVSGKLVKNDMIMRLLGNTDYIIKDGIFLSKIFHPSNHSFFNSADIFQRIKLLRL